MSYVSKHQTPLLVVRELYDIVAPVVWAAWTCCWQGWAMRQLVVAPRDPQGLCWLTSWGVENQDFSVLVLPTGCQVLGSSYRAQGYRACVRPPVEAVIWKEHREDPWMILSFWERHEEPTAHQWDIETAIFRSLFYYVASAAGKYNFWILLFISLRTQPETPLWDQGLILVPCQTRVQSIPELALAWLMWWTGLIVSP